MFVATRNIQDYKMGDEITEERYLGLNPIIRRFFKRKEKTASSNERWRPQDTRWGGYPTEGTFNMEESPSLTNSVDNDPCIDIPDQHNITFGDGDGGGAGASGSWGDDSSSDSSSNSDSGSSDSGSSDSSGGDSGGSCD